MPSVLIAVNGIGYGDSPRGTTVLTGYSPSKSVVMKHDDKMVHDFTYKLKLYRHSYCNAHKTM